jgi:hypothetical protein
MQESPFSVLNTFFLPGLALTPILSPLGPKGQDDWANWALLFRTSFKATVGGAEIPGWWVIVERVVKASEVASQN